MFFNRCFEQENNNLSGNVSCDTNMMNMNNGCSCPPVMECPQERVCHRQMCYEVPHVCPFM